MLFPRSHEIVSASTAVAFGCWKGETNTGSLLLRGEANMSSCGVPNSRQREWNCSWGSSHSASSGVTLDRESAGHLLGPLCGRS